MADLLLAQSPTRQRATPAFHHNLYGSSSSSSSSSSGSSPQSSVIESTFHQHLRRATSSASSSSSSSCSSSMTTTTTVTSSLTTSIQSTSTSSPSSLMNSLSSEKSCSKESMKRPSDNDNKCLTNDCEDNAFDQDECSTETIEMSSFKDSHTDSLSPNDNRDGANSLDNKDRSLNFSSSPTKNNINQIDSDRKKDNDEHEPKNQVASRPDSLITNQQFNATVSSKVSRKPNEEENDGREQHCEEDYNQKRKKTPNRTVVECLQQSREDDSLESSNQNNHEEDVEMDSKSDISKESAACADSETGNVKTEDNNKETSGNNNNADDDNNQVNVSDNSVDSSSRYPQDDDGSDFDPSEVLKRMKVELHEDVQMCHQGVEHDDHNDPDDDRPLQKTKGQPTSSDTLSGSLNSSSASSIASSIIRGLKSSTAVSSGLKMPTIPASFSPSSLSSLVGLSNDRHHPAQAYPSTAGNAHSTAVAEYFQKLINFGTLLNNQTGSNCSSASSTSGVATISNTESPSSSNPPNLESIASALFSSANNNNHNATSNSSLDRLLMMQSLLMKQFSNNNLESNGNTSNASQDEFQQQISLANLLALQQQQSQSAPPQTQQLSPSSETRSNESSKDRFCDSCNIQFISAKTFKVHKELYCSGRHQQSTGPSSQISSSSSSTSSSTLASPPSSSTIPNRSGNVHKKNGNKDNGPALLPQSSLFKNIDLSGLRLPQLSSDSNGQEPIYVALSTNPLILVPFVWSSGTNQFVPVSNSGESQSIINSSKASTSLVYPNGMTPFNDSNGATSPKAPFITTLASLNSKHSSSTSQINKDNEFGKKRSLEMDVHKTENNALDLSGMIPPLKRNKFDDSMDGLADLMQKFTQQLQQQQQQPIPITPPPPLQPQQQKPQLPESNSLESISMFMNLLNGINTSQPIHPTSAASTSRQALSPSPSHSDPIASAFKDNPLFSQYLAAFLSTMSGSTANSSVSPSIPSPSTPTPSNGASGSGNTGADVSVKQGSSRCVECNIVFYKHENYLAHKELYCASRRNSVTLSVPPEIRSSPRPQSAASAGSAASGLSPASSIILSPRNMSTKSPRDEQASPSARETLTGSPCSQSNSNLAASPKPQVLQQFFCSACGIKFTSYDNLTAHQTYYCLKRQQPGSSSSAGPNGTTLPPAPPAPGSPNPVNPVLTAQQILAGLSASGADLSMLGDPTTLTQQIALMAAAIADNAKNDAQEYKTTKEIVKPEVLVKPVAAPTSSAAALQTYKCTICGYKGHTMRGMRTHVRVHTQELSESGAYEEDFIVANTDIPDPPGPRARGQTGLGKQQQQQIRRKSSTNESEDFKKSDNKAEGEALSGAQMHSCQFCRYTSNYKGNVIRHIKLVHKDIASAQMAINLALQQQILANDLLLTPEMSLLIGASSSEPNSSELEKPDSPEKEGLATNGKVVKSEVKLEFDESSLGENEDGRHCASCNISFTYRNSYLAHKKYYCTAVQGTSAQSDEPAEVDS